MRADEVLADATARCPLIAILRGVRPDEIVAIADGLVELGFSMIEVPLNSPDPLASIAAIARRYPRHVLVGAGTVLSIDQVSAVAGAGGRLIVAPNCNTNVIAVSAMRGLITLPGIFTPSEAVAAIETGATGLKLFPAEATNPAALRAQRAILPPRVPIFVVGGITPDTMTPWFDAGATGFGLGSSLYTAGASAVATLERGAAFAAALSARQGIALAPRLRG